MDGSKGQVDVSRAQTDTLSVLNKPETNVMDHGEGAGTYLNIGDTKCPVYETDGARNHADASTGQKDTPSIEMDTIKPANEMETISIPRKRVKPPDLPVEVTICTPVELDGLGDRMDMSSVCMDMHSVGVGTEMAEKEAENIRTPQNRQKAQNSPNTHKIVTSSSTYCWRRVSIDESDVYVPWSAPVEALGRTFAFGQPESREEAIVPSDAESERAGGSD